MFLFWSKTSLKASVHARTCSKLWFPQSLLESSKSGSRFFIIHLNFHQKSAKISIFRLISSYFFSSRAWISLWSSISISSILWQPFWMHICTCKPFRRISTIENWGRMSQICPKYRNIGSKTKALPIFLCATTSIHSWIFLTHNLMRLFPEKITTNASKPRIL